MANMEKIDESNGGKIKVLDVATDCQRVINMLKDVNKPPWFLKDLINDIKLMEGELNVKSWNFIRREVNVEAYDLAKKGIRKEGWYVHNLQNNMSIAEDDGTVQNQLHLEEVGSFIEVDVNANLRNAMFCKGKSDEDFVQLTMADCIDLPPGFRFHPTDEEIITHYLTPKIVDRGFSAIIIGEVDLNKCEPWDLPSRAKMGEKEMYFFCQRDRKYPTGMRTNRATESGYWKATGKDKEIYRGKGVLVGMKKTLVFYRGRAPKGEKTNWVMHEFRLEGKHSLPNLPKSAKDEWVVCRIIHKNLGLKRSSSSTAGTEGIIRDHDMMEYYNCNPTLPSLMDQGFDHIKANNMMMSVENQQVMMMDGHQYYPMMSSSINPPPQNNLLVRTLPPQSGYYLHQDEAFLRSLAASGNYSDGSSAAAMRKKQCKVEQYSNQSTMGGCPSQDTGLSADRNTDMSSVISSRNNYVDSFGEAWTSYGF
ncbi:hypothetical protein Cni_G15547 [Canna indica]|uniref:NAC domain-containing protein n=1 Tax=Canna indica TaxID=4628 RepID=A0AAQ3KDU5_9LILI|nr:hypothetical protein Cni_G15547 [Canna indica]